MKVEGGRLVITVDLAQEFGVSKTGKSITIASTEGNVSVPGHEEIKIGVNVYRKK
jgi:ABC-type lipoprotein release transport system permease subunit